MQIKVAIILHMPLDQSVTACCYYAYNIYRLAGQFVQVFIPALLVSKNCLCYYYTMIIIEFVMAFFSANGN